MFCSFIFCISFCGQMYPNKISTCKSLEEFNFSYVILMILWDLKKKKILQLGFLIQYFNRFMTHIFNISMYFMNFKDFEGLDEF
jgi:hypothetical protein